MLSVPPRLLPLLTIAGATGGAFLFRTLDLPLAYILGALVGSAIVTNIVGPMKGGRYMRRAGQLFVGASVGGVLSADVVAELGRLFPLMLAVAVAANAAGALLAVPISRIAGVSRLTGLLSCLPAGMAEMATLARDLGAHEQTVALIHTLRVILILTLIPLWLGVAGIQAAAPAVTGFVEGAEILAVVLLGGLIAAAASRFGVLNPWVIAPMLLCLGAVAAGFDLPLIPTPLLIAAQIAIGASLGLRFRLAEFRSLPRAALAGLISGALLIGVSFAAFGWTVARLGGLGPETATLAVMPGGLGEMIASAGALDLLPATVAGFQITRSILTNIFAPPLIRYALARRGGA
ncbi:MAG: AbrB family transcriptional regulator [Pseudomonadota bacterium]|nr:AbrB family transcriptional regulator [Pseudomonadota bacterium]